MCIGELCLQVGRLGSKKAKRLMDLVIMSCHAVFALSDHNYAEALQDSIIETLMCMVHGIETPEFSS